MTALVRNTSQSQLTQRVAQRRLLPALSVRQRGLLLPRDKGGTPHRTAVAVPEPAHGGRRWVGGAAKAMVRLGLSSEG